MIKTKKEKRVDRDDVSCDSHDEEGKEDGKEEEEVGRQDCDRRGGDKMREKEKRGTYEGDDSLRSTRSVNNTKADCGRG